ncbi:MAG TPA: hypothetical protein VF608_02255 [Thermoanaerobaculia bacterium]
MATQKDYQELLDQLAAFRETVARNMSTQFATDPRLAEAVSEQIEDFERSYFDQQAQTPGPADNGLADLIGLGANAPADLSGAYIVPEVQRYDETIASERIVAAADLYYVYQHETIGVFRVLQKLEQLWAAGAVRLSNGDGASRLYRFIRRRVLRFTRNERLGGYCRAFGYCSAAPPMGSKPNAQFHPLFTHFIREVALFWRDKRISEVMRERANDPTFGSIATVRRAGLDLRNNLKFASYGHINVLRVEALQLLDEAFRILGAEDVRKLFGADTPWDVVEEILSRYFNDPISTSPRQRMAVAGRELLKWLAQPHILRTGRTQFEAQLVAIAEFAEEWLTSAESIGITSPRQNARIFSWKPREVTEQTG